MTIQTEQLSQPQSHAQLSVALAILRSFWLIALLALTGCCFAISGMVFAPSWPIKLLGLLVFFLGLGVFYFALRIRIDVTLFERWDSLDIVELDVALSQLRPNFLAGRTLETRLNASLKLFKQGASLCFLQIILLLIMAWMMNIRLFSS
jgi:hypothetical protein